MGRKGKVDQRLAWNLGTQGSPRSAPLLKALKVFAGPGPPGVGGPFSPQR